MRWSTLTGLGPAFFWESAAAGGHVGTDQSTYTPGDAEVGGAIRVTVFYTDAFGTFEQATSDPSALVANVNDARTGGVIVVGAAVEDSVLTANTSTLSDDDGLGALHYQWQRDDGAGFSNVGSDHSTYTLGDADVGATMRVVVSYTDQHGTAESLTSGATDAVSNVNDAPAGGVSIAGTVAEDQVLTADTSALSDNDGLGPLHYQWQRDSGAGFADVGTDDAAYTLGDDDVGASVRVVVSYTDGYGTSEVGDQRRDEPQSRM